MTKGAGAARSVGGRSVAGDVAGARTVGNVGFGAPRQLSAIVALISSSNGLIARISEMAMERKWRYHRKQAEQAKRMAGIWRNDKWQQAMAAIFGITPRRWRRGENTIGHVVLVG